MRRRTSQLTRWIIPIMLASLITGGFIYLIPVQDRSATYNLKASERATGLTPARQSIDKAASSRPVQTSRSEEYLSHKQPSLFKWTDASGRIHYGDKPPEGVQAVAVDTEATNTSLVQIVTPRLPNQQRPVTTLPSLRTTTHPSMPENPQHSQRCQWVQNAIRLVDARMRAGYQNWEGERLRAERRQLVTERAEVCH